MTRAEYAALRPGDVIRSNKSGALRVVTTHGTRTRIGCRPKLATGLGLIKIGRSWTDPNPEVFYAMFEILRWFRVTGKRAPKALALLPLLFRSKGGPTMPTSRGRIR